MKNRIGFIGGSDVAAILGVSKWKTPYALWCEKKGQAGEPSTPERDKVLNRGKRLEPYIRQMVQDEYGMVATDINRIYTDSEHDFMRCEVDVQFGDENGEIKTVHPFASREWGQELSDDLPLAYVAQCQWGLMITGRKVCHVFALIGDDLRRYKVTRDDVLIGGLRAKVLEFWHNHVLADVPPDAVNSDDILAMYNGETSGKVIEANTNLLVHINQLRACKERMKELDGMIEAESEAIKLSMRDAEIIAMDGKPLVTWKSSEVVRLDTKAIKHDHPELCAKYARKAVERRFNLK